MKGRPGEGPQGEEAVRRQGIEFSVGAAGAVTYCEVCASTDKLCCDMRILLRNRITNKYFLSRRTWTENAAEALGFHFIAMAKDFAQRWGLRDVELAFAFEEAEGVTVLPPMREQRLAA